MLSVRLSKIRSHFDQHESVWDIGCDHGKLGLSFMNEETVKSIHLVDPSEAVISVLKNHIDSYITDPFKKLTLLHAKGQDIELSPLRKIIFIAGMGGKEILEIADSLEEKLSPADDLVISPHRDILQVRRKLMDSKFFLGSEKVIKDEGRFYQVISLNLRGKRKIHPFGEEIFTDSEYLDHQINTFQHHQDSLSKEYLNYLQKSRSTSDNS